METGIVWVGVIGSIASVLGYLLTIRATPNRAVHVLYVFLIVIAVSAAAFYRSGYVRSLDVARQADQLVHDFQGGYTRRGFVHAALAFLEKNRDIYPDAYLRAVTMCAQFACDSPSGEDMIELGYAMRGVVKGLGTLER